MAHEIEFSESAIAELEELNAFTRKKIHGEIKKQLVHQPGVPSKNRKCLDDPPAGFEFDPPLWELRVGKYRVFYEVNEADDAVYVRAVRLKPPDKRTEDVLK